MPARAMSPRATSSSPAASPIAASRSRQPRIRMTATASSRSRSRQSRPDRLDRSRRRRQPAEVRSMRKQPRAKPGREPAPMANRHGREGRATAGRAAASGRRDVNGEDEPAYRRLAATLSRGPPARGAGAPTGSTDGDAGRYRRRQLHPVRYVLTRRGRKPRRFLSLTPICALRQNRREYPYPS